VLGKDGNTKLATIEETYEKIENKDGVDIA